MLRFHLAALTMVMVSACFADGVEDEIYAQSSQSIVQGQAASDPAVVVVYHTRSGTLCTGTMIAPKVVLTAKHCVQGSRQETPYEPDSLIVGAGDAATAISKQLKVSSISTTPGSYTLVAGSIGNLLGEDVGLISLSESSGLPIYEIFEAAPTSLAGEQGRVIGYGETPAGNTGVKNSTQTKIERVESEVIYTPQRICQGDSGGPLLVELEGIYKVVGVASFVSAQCGSTNGKAGYNRIDIHMSLIKEALDAAAICVPQGKEICDGIDNDCNDQVDEICFDEGAPCQRDDECTSRFCLAVDGRKVCATRCRPESPMFGCKEGYFCKGIGGCEGYCALGNAGKKDVGDFCVNDKECSSLKCGENRAGEKVCATPCNTQRGACPYGETCIGEGDSDCGICLETISNSDGRNQGEICDDPSQCMSDKCYQDGAFRYCTRGCTVDHDCGDGFHCRTGQNLCVRGKRGLYGSSCAVDSDCADTLLCSREGGAGWCTQSCSTRSCPEEYSCEKLGELSVCKPNGVPLGGLCADSSECAFGRCEAGGVEGEKICTQSCEIPFAPCGTGFQCLSPDGRDHFCAKAPLKKGVKDDKNKELLPFDGRPRVGGGGCRASDGSSSDSLFLAFALCCFALLRKKK